MRNKKKTISKKLKEEVWIKHFGETFSAKCPISWCSHKITVFCFDAGHNIPESKGGRTAIDNLIPICGECNRSMGDRFTILEFSAIHQSSKPTLAPPTPAPPTPTPPTPAPPTPTPPPTLTIVKKQNFFQRLFCFSQPSMTQKSITQIPKYKQSSHSSVRKLFYK
jgi:hypothetical protein